MLRNYLKIALRNIFRNKLFSVVNILGLAFGIGSALLIFLWVNDELSFDHFHANGKRIYRVMENQKYTDGRMFTFSSTPGPMAPFIKEKFPEIEKATRLTWEVNNLFQVGEKSFYENGIYADQDLLDMYSLPLLSGNVSTALSDKNSIVIDRTMAEKYFGKDDAVGKVLLMNTKNSFTVTGVLKEIPKNSSFRMSYIIPFQIFMDENKTWLDRWDNNNIRTNIMLRSGANEKTFSAKLVDEVKLHNEKTNVKLFLQPYEDVYLHGNFENGVQSGGRIEFVKIFFIVAVFVLLIASINFMNLATAQATKRAKEVGLRKVIGALPGQLFKQFMGESFLTVILSAVIAIGLVLLLMPVFNVITGKNLSLDLLELKIAGIFIGVILVTAVAAGSYPSFFMSEFKPVQVLKGQLRSGLKATLFRKVLVVAQFSISIVLIICTAVVFRQMKFMENHDIGFVRDHVFYVWMDGDVQSKYETVKQRLLSSPGIESVTASGQLPIGIGNSTSGVTWEGKDPEAQILFTNLNVDLNFIQTMKMEMVEGRPFERDRIADTSNYIVNQKAADKFGFKNSVAGQDLTMWGKKGKIVGVVKDFNFGSLHNPIEPLIMHVVLKQQTCLLVRTKEGQSVEALRSTEKIWKEYAAGYPFKYSFLNQDWEGFYKSEGQQGQLFNTLAVLSIFISCLGLFGLSAFSAERRTKELGVRKVLGASTSGLVNLMNREFTLLVIIAAFIGCPAGYYFMNRWLAGYAFHVQVGVVTVIGSAVACLAISIFTVTYHSLKVSRTNPTTALRYE
jgi:putative ABC transport system permease protein